MIRFKRAFRYLFLLLTLIISIFLWDGKLKAKFSKLLYIRNGPTTTQDYLIPELDFDEKFNYRRVSSNSLNNFGQENHDSDDQENTKESTIYDDPESSIYNEEDSTWQEHYEQIKSNTEQIESNTEQIESNYLRSSHGPRSSYKSKKFFKYYNDSFANELMKKSISPREWNPVAVVRQWKNYVHAKVAEGELTREKNIAKKSRSDPYSINYSSSLIFPVKIKRMQNILPSIIWTYWPDGEDHLPPLISWKRYNPQHNIIVLSRNTIERVLDFTLPIHFDKVTYQNQKDWVKLAVLLQEGGTWIDPSFIMASSISFVDESVEKKDGLMFFNDYYTLHPNIPFFEGYFISVGKWSYYGFNAKLTQVDMFLIYSLFILILLTSYCL